MRLGERGISACLRLLALAASLSACRTQSRETTARLEAPRPMVDPRVDATAATASNAVAQIAVVDERSCARLVNGTVKCWGLMHDDPALPEGSGDRSQPYPTTISTLDNIVDIAIGYDHSCLRLSTGRMRCWGANDVGQLGDGTHNSALFPTADPGLQAITEIAVGRGFTCARSESGVVSCWGKNAHGELADGTEIDRTQPNIAPSITAVLHLALAGDHGLPSITTAGCCSGGRARGASPRCRSSSRRRRSSTTRPARSTSKPPSPTRARA